MNPGFRTTLIVIAAITLAVWTGINLAQEQFFIATLSAGASLWAVMAWTRGPLSETWLIGFLFFGYVIGNRGFAQIMPVRGIPLFLGELGIAFAGALFVLRGALQRTFPLQRDWLTGLLVLWFAVGAGRLMVDVRSFGLLAVRDFAMVYYLLYFVIVFALAAHETSRRLLHLALLVTFSVLPVTATLANLFPDFFRTNLTANGVPLIFYKDDLLATFLFAGFIYLVPKQRFVVTDWWRWLTALSSLFLGLAELSRAAIVGLVVALLGFALARRWQPVRTVFIAGLVGVAAVGFYATVQHEDLRQTRLYALYEHVTSVFDFSGTGRYVNAESADSGDNNRFRLVWWWSVTSETFLNSPLLGLGFGYDLARGFLAEYYPGGGEDFTARSPHSIIVSTFGRMGFVGLAVFLAILATLIARSVRIARWYRADAEAETALTLHGVAWIILCSACFGVVLEGPMGAIPFWIILGLAHREVSRLEETTAMAPTTAVPKTATELTAAR